ncbi:MAG: hypothetical protein E7672_01265 [Ruminococcaceae bacterium]|nr:hypothetical protein [Oscillospiraceae bacterium]
MADGSVTIGVSLDTSEIAASAANIEAQMSSLGTRMGASLSASIAAVGIGDVLNSSLSDVNAAVSAAAQRIIETMRLAAQNSALLFRTSGWQTVGSSAMSEIASGVRGGEGFVNHAVREVSSSAKGAFSTSGWVSIGEEIMSGVAAGILSAGREVVAAIKKVSLDADTAVKDYYQIKSPSALMRDEVGVMISRGIAEGILSGSSYVNGAMASVYGGRESRGVDSSLQGMKGSVTQNIYLRDDDASPYRTARRIRRESEAIFRL